jgi:hypothetical protein
MNTETETLTVKEQTLNAYADCNGRDRKSVNRNLEFRATDPVSREEAVEIMCEALSVTADEEGYNDFYPGALFKLPDDAKVWLARENSVCVYFATAQDVDVDRLRRRLHADECDFTDNGECRVWWD